MSKERNEEKRFAGKAIEQELERRRKRRARRARSEETSAPVEHLTRRDFVKQVSAAGALLGLPLLAPNARADDDEADTDASDGKSARKGRKRQLLFFNLSHLNGANTTHHLHLAGRKYRLTRVRDHPG